jgi:hypothetical protein
MGRKIAVCYQRKGENKWVLSTSQFLHNLLELETHNEKHFNGSHKKENLTR